MLSNFQFGNQSLLQSFLIGQPEFREILQNPSMQQLRQRVIAACHIGPMDIEETQGYIEHRLICAGWSKKPLFNSDTYESIFNVSGGIPRRINSVCDRLLLLGFLENKNIFQVEDVLSISKEILEESGHVSFNNIESDAGFFDGDKNFDGIDSDYEVSLAEIDSLEKFHLGNRIDRIEKSMLRLEKSNSEIISILKRHFSTNKFSKGDGIYE
jgi:general secretion pathway protein A